MRPRFVLSIATFLFTLCIVGAHAAGGDPAQPAAAPANKILLASTIGPIDAGIVGALEEAFTKKTGIAVEHAGFPAKNRYHPPRTIPQISFHFTPFCDILILFCA
jgi:hypothetical protein